MQEGSTWGKFSGHTLYYLMGCGIKTCIWSWVPGGHDRRSPSVVICNLHISYQYGVLRVVGHVVAKDENPFFFGVVCKKTPSTGSKNLESITNVQKSLTFLLRTTAQTAIFFCHQLSN